MSQDQSGGGQRPVTPPAMPVSQPPAVSPAPAPKSGGQSYLALRQAARDSVHTAQQGQQLHAENKALVQNQIQDTKQAAGHAALAAAAAEARGESGSQAAMNVGKAQAQNVYAVGEQQAQKNMHVAQDAANTAAGHANALRSEAQHLRNQDPAQLRSEAMAATRSMAIEMQEETNEAAEVARQQFEQRWSAVLEQERQLKCDLESVERIEKRVRSLIRKDEPNFPPKCCCISPIVFHDISLDIGVDRQFFVKTAYFNFYLTLFIVLYNFAVALTMVLIENEGAGDDDKKEKTSTDVEHEEKMLSHLGVSVVLLFGCILSFVLWYWPIYKACATGAAGQHIMARVGLVIGMLFNLLMVIGPLGYGGCGILYGLLMKNIKGTEAFWPCLSGVIVFGAQFAWFMFAFYRMVCVYGKEDKASLAKAQAEMARDSVMTAAMPV